jgi:hypothetical protein
VRPAGAGPGGRDVPRTCAQCSYSTSDGQTVCGSRDGSLARGTIPEQVHQPLAVVCRQVGGEVAEEAPLVFLYM